MQLMWFRQDLRIEDNAALWHATQAGPCVALIILSPQQWQLHDDATVKINFYLRQVQYLAQQLQQLNIPLHVAHCANWQTVAECIVKLCQHYDIHAVHSNMEFGYNEQKRDLAVRQQLSKQHIAWQYYQDRTLFPVGSIRNQSGQAYQVFSAFKKYCYAQFSLSLPQCYPAIRPQQHTKFPNVLQALEDVLQDYVVDETLLTRWPVGEHFAQHCLDQFIDTALDRYDQTRDFPAQTGTSQLAAYLNIGILSIRQCLKRIFNPYGQFYLNSTGQQTWLDELLWREFYQHILFDYPQVSKHQPFKAATRALQWRDAPDDLHAWQNGQTGVPIVDAGMRQLKATAWMHNRVRMICAMFLCKNLWIDWRHGERYFMQHLMDGDLAANNGGWQWCASTGTDAVPYFRVFNPISQSQRFDATGAYLRQWLPELAHLDDKSIHDPYAYQADLPLDYPRPIVDLKQSRQAAIAAFQQLSSTHHSHS
ncbi:deoxyribodipyrimidine photo-lyase [Acinetobacter larvae]|uniref:Deoxyribodipyrimidine photo-lyase n=1 Tax=Acinetobacter larvae TaxID=1789224 RepID=A0A1B2M153_9GAMM|nr:deoxyribodipyrimidine photo-lyase [Acinetobacter larvae]AOA58927.1 deoxyribodipyrimidine photolyase [Acinetobacter larvae]